MNRPAKCLYGFGPFVLDKQGGLLLRAGEVVPLTPKAFETLVALVENSGHTVGKDELMRRVWPDSFVEENNLSQNISLLRRALGQAEAQGDKYIETVPKRGYRFVAPVSELGEGRAERAPASADDLAARDSTAERETPPGEQRLREALHARLLRAGSLRGVAVAPSPAPEVGLPSLPVTKYARNGNVNIAYQVIGDGPLDLVFVMGWVSHLEYFWAEPSFALFLTRLASFSRLILFDKRGTGLSDSVPLTELPTLEQRMDDLRAVMSAVGSERAALCGVSEGGPMSALFAATYPEKTLALVMIGTYAKRIWEPDYPWAPTAEARQKFYELIEREWGGPVGLEERAPSMAHDSRFREWWATYLRMGASPGAALALTRMNADIDVRHVLPSIRVPTLVIHRAEDACLKVEEGRYVAARIPGAKFIELPGADHLPFVGDQDSILDEVEEFLTGASHALQPDRVLATVLAAHISPPAPEQRSQASAELLPAYAERIRAEIEWWRGRISEMSAAGFLATFDGPARAIRAACALSDAAQELGVKMQLGLHTGECDVLDERVSGVAVEIGAQVAGQAQAGEVLVSRTVKDLVAGSGIEFAERGVCALGGSLGEWRIFKVKRGACL